MKPIRLMLVDDHEVVRTGLRTFLDTQSGFQVIAEAEEGEAAIQTALEVRPDVVVMDISMPGMDGLEATRRLKAEWPEAAVLALTVHEDKRLFLEMLSAGVAGYLTKRAAADELVQAIQTVLAGNAYLQPSLARWLLEDYQLLVQAGGSSASPPGAAQGLEALSERERQVLEQVAQGRTNPEIGAQLGLSPKTIARHRERIMKRLNIHSRTELVKFAIRTGLISSN